jgi:PAS domain S-box-containing protein
VYDWLKYKPGEIIGKNISELLIWASEESRAKVMEKFAQRMQGKKVRPFVLEFVTKNGKQRIGQIVAKFIRDKSGKIIKNLVMISDITLQQRAVEKHMEILNRNTAFFQAIPDLIFIITREGTFVDFKADHDEKMAISRDQIIGKNIRDAGFPEEYVNLIFHYIEKIIKSGEIQTFEHELMTPEGLGSFECRMVKVSKTELLVIVRNITKSKEFEKELRLKNIVFESSLAANITADVIGNINHVNQAFLTIWGYDKKEEVIGKPISHFFLNVEKSDRILKCLNDTGEWSGEFIARRKDGNSFISQGFATTVCDNSGKILGYQSASLDITERKRAEKKLQESEERFKNIAENALEFIWEVDVNGKYTYTNPVIEKILGYRPEEIIGKKRFYDLFHPREKNQLKKAAFEVFKRLEPFREFENRNIHKDGKTVWLSTSGVPILDNEGNLLGYRGTDTDITERKQVAEEIEKRQKYLESVLHNAPDAIVTLDSSHNIVEWNPGAENIFGYKRNKVIGKNIDNLITNPLVIDEAKGFTKRVLAGKKVLPQETIRYRKDGTPVNVIVSGSPIKIKGELEGIVVVYIDISKRKKVEEELLKSEKLESLGILAGGIAHDFNNILASILVNVGLLMLDVEKNTKLTSKLKEIERAIFRARDLTQQLITFSKGGAPIKKTVSIRELLENTAFFTLSGSNVKCKFFFSKDLWDVEIDEGQISQVIQNLIINANQAMPEGGTIQIRVQNVTEIERKGLPLKKGRYIRIEVKDRGIGIPKAHLKKIFDPFFSTKQKGSGLGLSTAFSIIKNHNGLITVESELGKTTTFFIYLPTSNKKGEKKKKPMKKISSGYGKVLLMDDDEMILDSTSELLRKIGYIVVTAKDGAEAIKLYQEARRSKRPIECLILDLTVPNGLGGKETIKELLKIDPGVKAIASSGYTSDPIISNYKEYGFVGSIPKPYMIADLSLLLKKVIFPKIHWFLFIVLFLSFKALFFL